MAEGKKPTRILIVDDHPLVRHALRVVLEMEKDFEICGEAEDASSALSLIQKTPPDIVILDITLKSSDGFAVLKEIKAEFPQVKVFFFSAHEESLYGLRALRSGAMGYLTKGESHEKLLEGLRKIRDGNVYLSEELEIEYRQGCPENKLASSAVALLTNRELEVFQLIGHGLSTEAIAEKLKVSVNTVQSHRAAIRQKMRLGTFPELMRCAFEFINHGTIPKPQQPIAPPANFSPADRTVRSEAILDLLQDGKPHSAPEIARRLGVSLRTVFRDVHFLRDVLKQPICGDGAGFWIESE
jgi:DNA-binding NarL/FixJ family response regulator